MPDDPPICVRCERPVVVSREHYVACADPSCPMHPRTDAARKRVVERYIEGFRTGDRELIHVVVAEGAVQAPLAAGGRIDAVFCDVFSFRGDRISRLVTYQVDRLPGEQTRRAFEA